MDDQTKSEVSKAIAPGWALPDWVTDNVVVALGKGILGIGAELTNLPKNWLANINETIKQKGRIKREFVDKASAEYQNILAGDIDLADRALRSHGIKLIDEQANKDAIGAHAIDRLQSREPSSVGHPAKIDSDWLTAFWNLAATKSNEDIRVLFGRILADEVVGPGAISLHTLQTLSILSSKVGGSFSKLSNLSFAMDDAVFVIHPHVFNFQNIGSLDKYGLSLDDLLDLDGAGLIRSAETITIQFGDAANAGDGDDQADFTKYKAHREIDYGGQPAMFDIRGLQLRLLYYTQAGKELRNLLELKRDEAFTAVLKESLGDSVIID